MTKSKTKVWVYDLLTESGVYHRIGGHQSKIEGYGPAGAIRQMTVEEAEDRGNVPCPDCCPSLSMGTCPNCGEQGERRGAVVAPARTCTNEDCRVKKYEREHATE